jgi:ADP-heptose:LPS heptosyltransferase
VIAEAVPRVPPEVLPSDRPARVAVLRALALGDMLCAIPAFRALRRALPDARVSLIGLPWAAELVDRYPAYLDEFIEFPGYPGVPEVQPVDATRVTAFMEQMQARRFDLAIQLQGDGTSTNTFTCLLGARWALGATLPERPMPCAGTWVPYSPHAHEIDRQLVVISALGSPGDDGRLEFSVRDRDRDDLTNAVDGARLEPETYVCIHPGAAAERRQWAPERFAAVADALGERGFKIVLTGVESERLILDEVSKLMKMPAIDLAGRTTIGALGALVADARLVVSNDTGIAHLAAALATPTVTVAVATDPARWAPIGPANHVVVGGVREANGCKHPAGDPHRCFGDGCTYETRRTGTQPTAEVLAGDVIAAASELLDAGHLGA